MKRFVCLLATLLSMAATPARGESLFDARTYGALTADNKACRVGDVITVVVYENSSASSSTDTTTQRKNNLNASFVPLGFGKPLGAAAGVNGDFVGGGTTQRANKLLATLSVTVREVLPNGDLAVAGEHLLTVNEEQHKVLVEGRVRPQDISNDNVVLSTRLGDARITFVGSGDLSLRQQRAWWRKILDWMGF